MNTDSLLQRGLYHLGPPVEPLSQEQLKSVHDTTIEILSKTGFYFACESVREIFKSRGFRFKDDRVLIPEKEILKALETVPKSFVIRGRNPEHDVVMKKGTASVGLGRGAVHIVEPDGTFRSATTEDCTNALKLAQHLDILEHVGPLSFPFDIDRRNIHLWSTMASIKYTDKIYSYAGRQDMEILATAYGTTTAELEKRSDCTRSPGQATVVVQSPLTITKEDCRNLLRYSRCGIAYHVASMPVAGTSGPCTLAGTIVLQNCENLVPILFSQLVRPGSPVFYGAIAGHADMMSLRPRFGTSEARIIEMAGGQLARYYGLSCRGNVGLTDAPAHDFQSGAQAMLSTLSVLQGGPNFLTGCGLLGSYMGASLAKIILDVELVVMAKRFLSPIRTDANTLAGKVIEETGPGGCFIEHDHTLDNYRNEFLTENLFRSPDYESWKTSGKTEIVQAAQEKALKIIDSYRKPPIDQGLEEEIDAYVKRNWV